MTACRSSSESILQRIRSIISGRTSRSIRLDELASLLTVGSAYLKDLILLYPEQFLILAENHRTIIRLRETDMSEGHLVDRIKELLLAEPDRKMTISRLSSLVERDSRFLENLLIRYQVSFSVIIGSGGTEVSLRSSPPVVMGRKYNNPEEQELADKIDAIIVSDSRYKSRSPNAIAEILGKTSTEIIEFCRRDAGYIVNGLNNNMMIGLSFDRRDLALVKSGKSNPATAHVREHQEAKSNVLSLPAPSRVGPEEFKAKLDGALSQKKHLNRSLDALSREISEDPAVVLKYVRANDEQYYTTIFKNEIYIGLKDRVDESLAEKEKEIEEAMQGGEEGDGPAEKADLRPVKSHVVQVKWADITEDLGIAYLNLNRIYRKLAACSEKALLAEVIRNIETLEANFRKSEKTSKGTSNATNYQRLGGSSTSCTTWD